jgi:hypothetical protein
LDLFRSFPKTEKTSTPKAFMGLLRCAECGFGVTAEIQKEKRVLAQKLSGSNFVLDCKKARGSCVKPWSLLVENSSSGGNGAR